MNCDMEDRASVHTLYKPDYASDSHASDGECAAICKVGLLPPRPARDFWLHNMLRTHFFTSCHNHKELKKNEATHFCVDCGSSCGSLCAHCVPHHAGHRLIQIRRYVYCDVVRATDMVSYVDIAGIQTYIINQAKVIFLNPRPHSKLSSPGATDACQTCNRCLRDGCSFCSLSCKVDALVADGKLSMPAGGASSESSDACQVQLGETDGEQQGPCQQQHHHHHLGHGDLASAGSLRSSTDGSSDSEDRCRRSSSGSGSFCSRRKQMSPRRSPYL